MSSWQRLKCRIGLHLWTRWEDCPLKVTTQIYGIVFPGTEREANGQCRRCEACGIEELRRLG